MKRKSGWLFLLIFALFWSGVTVSFDTIILRGLAGQLRTSHFATVEGKVLSSEVSRHRGSKGGTTYGADIEYEYIVEGRRYVSDRVRYGQMKDSNGAWARETVNTHKVGSTCIVYFDPAAPAESVLQTGVNSQQTFVLLFLTPFNCVMIGIWAAFIFALRSPEEAGGARIVTEPGRILVFLKKLHPFFGALAAFGICSFIEIFALGIPFSFSPPAQAIPLAWGMCFVIAIAAYFKIKKSRRTDPPDLIIDANAGTLSIPGMLSGNSAKNWSEWRAWKKAGRPPRVLSLADLRSVQVDKRVVRNGNKRSTSFFVTVTAGNGDESVTHDIQRFGFEGGAESLADWLRTTLMLPAVSVS